MLCVRIRNIHMYTYTYIYIDIYIFIILGAILGVITSYHIAFNMTPNIDCFTVGGSTKGMLLQNFEFKATRLKGQA